MPSPLSDGMEGRKDMPAGDLVNPLGQRVQIPRCSLVNASRPSYALTYTAGSQVTT